MNLLLAHDVEPDDTRIAVHYVDTHPDDHAIKRGVFIRIGSEIIFVEASFPTYRAGFVDRTLRHPFELYVIRGAMGSVRFAHKKGVQVEVIPVVLEGGVDFSVIGVNGTGPIDADYTVLIPGITVLREESQLQTIDQPF